MDYSLSFIKGGYLHDNGTYILEDSIRIESICEEERDDIDDFIIAVKEYFNQESVLLIKQYVNSEFRR